MNEIHNNQIYSTSPLISVIIIAYMRKKFLRRAIESVLKQRVDGYSIEILVVKNFEDSDIDSFILENGVIGISSKYVELGEKLSEGIEMSRGDIISFLEDDDYFLPGKLKKVADTFLSDAEIVYLHNSALEVIEDGDLTGRIIMSVNNELTFEGDMSFSQLMELLKKGAHGNNSCISIKRELASILSPRLARLNVTSDGFILLSALELKKKLKFSVETLTACTVHESFTHLKITDYDNYVLASARKASIMYEDKKKGRQILASESDNRTVILAADYIELKEKLNLNLFSTNKLITVRDVAKYLYFSLYGRRYSGIFGAVIHAFSLLSKSGAQKITYIFYKTSYL